MAGSALPAKAAGICEEGCMLPYEPVEDCAPFRQALERTDLVGAHETAVALDIRCEDNDEASADCHRV